jgi:hypothetical protein
MIPPTMTIITMITGMPVTLMARVVIITMRHRRRSTGPLR